METTSNKTQQSTTENTAAQPTITAEEYTQLSAILERLNADKESTSKCNITHEV